MFHAPLVFHRHRVHYSGLYSVPKDKLLSNYILDFNFNTKVIKKLPPKTTLSLTLPRKKKKILDHMWLPLGKPTIWHFCVYF